MCWPVVLFVFVSVYYYHFRVVPQITLQVGFCQMVFDFGRVSCHELLLINVGSN